MCSFTFAVRLFSGHDLIGRTGVQIHRRTRGQAIARRSDEKFALSDAQRTAEIPPREWGNVKRDNLNLSFDLRVEPLNHYKLDAATTQRLREGDIVALDDQYTFIQRIPRSHYVLAVGPVPYLYFLHQMRLLDIALMALIAFSLAFPVFI